MPIINLFIYFNLLLMMLLFLIKWEIVKLLMLLQNRLFHYLYIIMVNDNNIEVE